MDMVKKIQDMIVKVLLVLGAIIMAVLLVSVFLQVVFRYILQKPLSWSEELARYCFVWVSMLGAAATVPKSLTQGIDLLVKRFPENVQTVSNLLARALTTLFSLVLVLKGWELTTIVHFQTSAVMGIRMSLIYSSIPVAALLMIVILGLDSIVNYKDITTQGS